MRTLYLVRHCEYENPLNLLAGRLPMPLSEHGIKQAEAMRQFFTDIPVDMIYTSAVVRTRQTAEYISGGKTPIMEDPRLLETFSAYQGYQSPVTPIDWHPFWEHQKDLGGETWMDISKRMGSLYDDLEKTPHETVVIVSHGDPLYLLYRYSIDGKKLIDSDDPFGMPDSDYQKRGTVRKIEFTGGAECSVSSIMAF